MVVEDNPSIRTSLCFFLESEGYDVDFADNGRTALAKISQKVPDLILLDVMMPEMNGYEACQELKKSDLTRDVPVIFLTALSEVNDKVKGFDVGGVDYITKPPNLSEVQARVKTHLTIQHQRKELERINADLEKVSEQIDRQNEQMRQLARRDPLTGLYNRRAFMERIKEEASRAQRYKSPFALALCDIDFFKNINDAHGHDCGDFTLTEIASIMKNNLQKKDFVARWGGEEFMILMPDTNLENAVGIAERLRSAVSSAIFEYKDLSLSVTMTFGVSVCDGEKQQGDCIKEADLALYEGKTGGRNRVVAYKEQG